MCIVALGHGKNGNMRYYLGDRFLCYRYDKRYTNKEYVIVRYLCFVNSKCQADDDSTSMKCQSDTKESNCYCTNV